MKASVVAEVCIIVDPGLASAAAIVPPMEDFWQANIRNVTEFVVLFMQFIFLSYRICSSFYAVREVTPPQRKTSYLLIKFP